MTVTAKQLMTLAGMTLNDVGADRWRFPELCEWINEAVGAVVLARPDSSSESVVVQLLAGTYQTVGAAHIKLLRVVRNITAAGPPRVGGRVISVAARQAMDAQLPYWHDTTKTPVKKEVRQVVFDADSPRDFYCYPPNDGTGSIEVVVSTMPQPVVIAGGADPTAIASYDIDVGLPDVYLTPLLDYVLYRALSKDDEGANPAGATAHYQAFATALGVNAQTKADSPNTAAAAQTVARAG